jgi:CheY-like chemotaxis protein
MAKIMVVDDNQDVRSLLKNILQADGHEVVESYCGSDCLEKLREGERPNLILLDVMMPGMDGWEVSRRIKCNSYLEEIPICILTAKGTDLDFQTSLESARADWHLKKPISVKELIETIDVLLEYKQVSTSSNKQTTFVETN